MLNRMIKLRNNIFIEFSNFIKKNYGINLTSEKKFLVESRLYKILKNTSYQDLNVLIEAFLSNKLDKTTYNNIIDFITTNTTEFFRESYHFDFLKRYIEHHIINNHKYFSIWSAACSTGEEPYSIAITLMEFQENFSFDFEILASDISEKVLKQAHLGIYDYEKIKTIPNNLLKKYFMISKSNSNLYRLIPEIRQKINFEKINLTSNFIHNNIFDIIFLRNVLIYFDEDTKIKIIKRITEFMHKSSVLILGNSESLSLKQLNLKRIANTIYQLK